MTNACERRIARSRPLSGLLLSLTSCLFWLVIGHQAHAAGCGHHSQPAFDYDASRIAVIYEGGNFYYYDNLQPCSGPISCKRSAPSSMDSAHAALSEDRSHTAPASKGCCWEFPLRPTVLQIALQEFYLSPAYDEPLRPPVAL